MPACRSVNLNSQTLCFVCKPFKNARTAATGAARYTGANLAWTGTVAAAQVVVDAILFVKKTSAMLCHVHASKVQRPEKSVLSLAGYQAQSVQPDLCQQRAVEVLFGGVETHLGQL